MLSLRPVLGGSNSSCQRVLDIGSGPGWFVWLLRMMGHEAHGMEPLSCDPSMTKVNMTQLLHIRPVDHRIQPLTRMPPPTCKYDVISAFLLCFDQTCGGLEPTKEHGWSTTDWQFWLTDVMCHFLAPGGSALLQLQPYANRSATNMLEAARRINSDASQRYQTRGKTKDVMRVRTRKHTDLQGISKRTQVDVNFHEITSLRLPPAAACAMLGQRPFAQNQKCSPGP